MDQNGASTAEKKEGASALSPRATLSLLELSMTNIGPFDSAKLRFLDDVDGDEVPVAIITGENGAGKSIIIDAIRGMFGIKYASLERPLWRPRVQFSVNVSLVRDGTGYETWSTAPRGNFGFILSNNLLDQVIEHMQAPNGVAPPWVVDFWRSSVPLDSYAISALSPLDHRGLLSGALQGKLQNADVTRLLCYFDYLRDSRVPRERQAGEVLYDTARRIVELSLLDGRLLDVERTTLTPMVQQGTQIVPLASLSSGNAYLIQHMIGMLGKMYAVKVLRGEDPESLCQTAGVLLLDEAENHLHPSWQKRFLPDVRSIFPNLQIIATTHSPFVVGSVPGAKVFVCRYDRETRKTTVEDVTRNYADLPVDDILTSAAFDGTEAFGAEISALMELRRQAIDAGDQAKRTEVEEKLYERNPGYFSYLKLPERLRALKAG